MARIIATLVCISMFWVAGFILPCGDALATPTYELTATDVYGLGITFRIRFLDIDNDGRFDFYLPGSYSNEPFLFYGPTYTWNAPEPAFTLDILQAVPEYKLTPYTEGHQAGIDWIFKCSNIQGPSGVFFIPWTVFSYSREDVPYPPGPAVPLPSAALLLTTGLIRLAWFRRRKQKGA